MVINFIFCVLLLKCCFIQIISCIDVQLLHHLLQLYITIAHLVYIFSPTNFYSLLLKFRLYFLYIFVI